MSLEAAVTNRLSCAEHGRVKVKARLTRTGKTCRGTAGFAAAADGSPTQSQVFRALRLGTRLASRAKE